mgnify:CR=1 FL=1
MLAPTDLSQINYDDIFEIKLKKAVDNKYVNPSKIVDEKKDKKSESKSRRL